MELRKRTGFSLVELAIVVSIIGILVALAIPLFRVILVQSRLSTFSNDLRVHSEAFHRFATEYGRYPAQINGSSISAELDGYLSQRWTEASPIGGYYSWIVSDSTKVDMVDAYIQVSPTAASPFTLGYNDLLKLDDELDDGSPGSGYFRISGQRVRFYIAIK